MTDPCKQITVGELTRLLSIVPQDLLVDVEGCDCSGEAVGISICRAEPASDVDEGKPETVMIRRDRYATGDDDPYGKMVIP